MIRVWLAILTLAAGMAWSPEAISQVGLGSRSSVDANGPKTGHRQTERIDDVSIPYGGHHEFGAQLGFSPVSGPVWGYSQDVQYLPVVLRYSYQLTGGRRFAFRYAPELSALSRLHETTVNEVNRGQHLTAYGSGITPAAFQFVVQPRKRVQPYLSVSDGFMYFHERVLSPEGSQFMWNLGFGSGANIFVSKRLAVQAGFRYQHLSNFNISQHNPGTDAAIYYLGLSRFHTRGVW